MTRIHSFWVRLWRRIATSSVVEYGIILLSGVLYAIALKYFVLPSKIILTGSEGIAAALSYYFENYWVFLGLYLAFHSVLLAFAFARVSGMFAFRSMLVVGTVAGCLAVFPELRVADPEPQNERIILVIFGGLLAGVAKAMAFRKRGSTGDEDIVGAYFAMKYLKPVGSIAVIAAVVSTAFGLAIDYLKNGDLAVVINTLMYTCLYIFISAETLNNLYRKFKLTMLTIITQRSAEVGKAIVATSEHRTFTIQKGVGGRSGEEYSMVRTILTHEELLQMIEAVQLADSN
jgi:uncharacterized membrane-anchored protein YitT (DUF2179 family)